MVPEGETVEIMETQLRAVKYSTISGQGVQKHSQSKIPPPKPPRRHKGRVIPLDES